MNEKIKLTSGKVEHIFMDCLFQEGENSNKAIIVKGITNDFGFHPQRIKEHENEIYELLMELPTGFRKSEGGGWTFLNACYDKNGIQWTGLHKIMEQLFCLGMAIKKVKYLLPRDMWHALPGGMPYYQIMNKEIDNE